MEQPQKTLFGGKYDEEVWVEEWQDMPEFVMEDKEPMKQLIVSFRDLEDYEKFSKLIEQPLTERTRSVWYPQVEIETYSDKAYI